MSDEYFNHDGEGSGFFSLILLAVFMLGGFVVARVHEPGQNIGADAAKAGLAKLGLSIISQEGHQLWQLNAVGVPDGADEAGVRARLLSDFGIEVGPGLGPMKGKIWRVGLMGHNATPANVERFLDALGQCLG